MFVFSMAFMAKALEGMGGIALEGVVKQPVLYFSPDLFAWDF